MLELLALGSHLLVPPQTDWSMRKRLLRERVAEVVATSNRMLARQDAVPRLVLERLHGQHGEFRHSRFMLVLDLESVQDARKFWHVYHETIPHEWAHNLNAEVHHSRGHGETFEYLRRALRKNL